MRDCTECVESNDINRLRLYSRPKCVDEVAFQEEVVAVLKKSLEGADVSIKLSWCLFTCQCCTTSPESLASDYQSVEKCCLCS